jgi:hypothetical protein
MITAILSCAAQTVRSDKAGGELCLRCCNLQAAAAAAVKLAIRELRTSESSAVIIFAAVRCLKTLLHRSIALSCMTASKLWN